MPRVATNREGQLRPMSFRIREDLREKLERAASANGQSFTQEIASRLDRSFQESDLLKMYFGRDDTITLIKTIAVHVNFVQALKKRSWTEDAETRAVILETVNEIMKSQFDAVDQPLEAEAQRAERLRKRVEAILRNPPDKDDPAAEDRIREVVATSLDQLSALAGLLDTRISESAAVGMASRRGRRKKRAGSAGQDFASAWPKTFTSTLSSLAAEARSVRLSEAAAM